MEQKGTAVLLVDSDSRDKRPNRKSRVCHKMACIRRVDLGGELEVEPRQLLEAPDQSQLPSSGALHGAGWGKL